MEDIFKKLLDAHNGEGNKTNGSTWRALRQAVLERDGYVCQECGDKASSVHHKEYGRIGENALISVCPKCHMRQHGLNPELTKRATWEMHDLQMAITSLERGLVDTKNGLDIIIKGYIVPQLPPLLCDQYGTNAKHLVKYWRRHYIAYLRRRLKEMKISLNQLRAEYTQAKLERLEVKRRA